MMAVTAPTKEAIARGGLPAELRERYGSDLSIPLRSDRPTVVANFVTTLDGVVSFQTPAAMGGGEISGFYEPDRFTMGLLRSLADVVLVGAGTVRAAPRHRWVPAHVSRAHADAFADLRRRLGLAAQPTTVVVTASGELDLDHPWLNDPDIPVLVLAAREGVQRLTGRRPSAHVEIVDLGEDSTAPRLLDVLAARGARLVLSEGGPHLIGQFLSAGLLDELFLTVAPQIAGRSDGQPRLSLVEGIAFDVGNAPWFDLLDVRRVGEHLFTRYRSRGGPHGNA